MDRLVSISTHPSRTLSLVPPAEPKRIDCECACGKWGQPRRKPWRDGKIHTRNCECSRYCLASKQKTTAMGREDRVARDSGGRRNPGSGAQGGMDLKDHPFQVEETSQQSVVRGFRSWWEGKGVQAKVHTLMHRQAMGPRALILSWDEEPQFAVVPYPDWASVSLEVEQLRAENKELRAELEMWRR